MRLSDAGLHQRQTKALYPDHRLSPWLTEAATRDRSNRLLGLLVFKLRSTAAKVHVIELANEVIARDFVRLTEHFHCNDGSGTGCRHETLYNGWIRRIRLRRKGPDCHVNLIGNDCPTTYGGKRSLFHLL
jgi:hypothetical protein